VYEAAKELAKKGYRAETKHAEAVTLMRSAEAQKARIEVEIGHTFIRAPFDGVLEKRYAELGDFLKVGNPVARIVDRDPLLVIAQVSEREIGHLKLGNPVRVTLISGERLVGKLGFLGTSADEATHTFRIEIEVPNPDLALRAGITAEIEISVAEITAHLVSPAVLTLNDQGAIGIKLIEGDRRVAFHRIEILSDGPEGVWLTGLPDTITVITVGQEFVRHGEIVRAVPESAIGSSP
jgi:multidrug efflux system membrane fusion protein